MRSFHPIFRWCGSRLIFLSVVLVFAAKAFAGQSSHFPVAIDRIDYKDLPVIINSLDFENLTVADLPGVWQLHEKYEGDKLFATKDGVAGVAEAGYHISWGLRHLVKKLDWPTLKRKFVANGRDVPVDPWIYDAYCRRCIEREVADIRREPKRRLVFPDKAAIPAMWVGVFPDSSVTQAARAIAPFMRRRATHPPDVDFGNDRDRRGRQLPISRVSQLRMPRCLISDSQDRAVTADLIQLLRERRIEEALGASLLISPCPEWMREPNRPFDTWRRDLLTLCGFDWEECLFQTRNYDMLAAAGSQKGARELLAACQRSESSVELEMMAAFLPSGEKASWDKADPRSQMPDDLQAEIIEFLNAHLTEGLSSSEMERRLKIFEKLRRPETKAALQRQLQHPSVAVASRVAALLNSMGERIAKILPKAPVRFQTFLNGKPWPNVELNCKFDGDNMRSFRVTTDADGLIEIPYDQFVASGRLAKRLTIYRSQSYAGPIRSEEEFEEPWVKMELPVPADLLQTTKVEFTACPLPIVVEYGTPPDRRGETTFRLLKTDNPEPYQMGFTLGFGQEVPAPSRLVLGTIQPGRYTLSISAPGSFPWNSEPFEVKPGMDPLRVKLQKGADLYAILVVPDNARGAGTLRLYQEGQDVSEKYPNKSYAGYHRALFAGVPIGKYQLRILSTAEYMREKHIEKWPAPSHVRELDPRLGVDCVGLAFDFEINESTPAIYDLGTFEVKPTEAMRNQAASSHNITEGAPPPITTR